MVMTIKIVKENAEKIEAALKEVNGNSFKHAFNTYTQVQKQVEKAERHLEALGLPMSARRGARFTAVSGEPVANAYRSTRNGTSIAIKRGLNGWFLVDVKHQDLYPNQGGESRLYLSQDQDEILVKALRRNYIVAV